jgi:hypothetical protein
MKINIFILLFLSLNFGCSGQSEKSNSTEVAMPQNEEKEIPRKLGSKENNNRIQNLKQLSEIEALDSYEMTKRKIEIQKKQFKFNNLHTDSIGKIFEKSLLNKIIPFWEGTEWSFEGHTSKPKSGSISCGYFVSTTLQDVGLNLNRYKLAQQSPINEAKSLALVSEVKEISERLTADNISAIKKYLKEGIHFIGFDESHVGFVLKKNDDLYLIHSNYVNAVGVEIEPIEKSEVFNSYNKFYLVELSTNEKLLNHWINKEQIEIIKK